MPLVVAAINCFMIYFFMKFAMDFRTFDYGSFLGAYGARFLGGKLAKPMQIVYEFNFNWLLIVCMALAYYAVFMSAVIFITLVVIHVPNVIYNLANGNLRNEMQVMGGSLNQGISSGAGSFLKYLLTAFCWAYIFSGQYLGGFGAYVNHAQLFTNKRTLRWAVVLSVILNWASPRLGLQAWCPRG